MTWIHSQSHDDGFAETALHGVRFDGDTEHVMAWVFEHRLDSGGGAFLASRVGMRGGRRYGKFHKRVTSSQNVGIAVRLLRFLGVDSARAVIDQWAATRGSPLIIDQEEMDLGHTK